MVISVAKVFLTQFSVSLPVVAVLYLATMANDFSYREIRTIALKSSALVAFFIGFSVVFGGYIIHWFTLSPDVVHMAGGLVMILLGSAFLLGSQGDKLPSVPRLDKNWIVFPLAFPFTMGPTPMYIALSMSTKAITLNDWIAFAAGQLLCVGLIGVLMMKSKWIVDKIGARGVVVAQQFVGLVFVAIGLEMLIEALLLIAPVAFVSNQSMG